MKLKAAAVLLISLLAGCEQQPPSAVQDTAYQWEKAYMDNNHDRMKEILYEDTFLAGKTKNQENSGLEKENIRYEIYYDEEFDWYYVLTEYENPQHGNKVRSELIVREKSDSWKIDYDRSMDLQRQEIQNDFDRIECINCK